MPNEANPFTCAGQPRTVAVVFWFRRPLYLRWFVGGALVLIAFAMDMRRGATEPYPFARRDLAKGQVVGPEDVEWRDVPVGLLPAPDLLLGALTRPVAVASPLIDGVTSGVSPIPEGWWAVPVGLPESVVPGAAVLIVVQSLAHSIPGVVVQPGGLGTFGVTEAGLVAVAEQDAVVVANAAARNELTVLIDPTG